MEDGKDSRPVGRADHGGGGGGISPRLILHGGAGNISRATLGRERRAAFRAALLEIVTRTNAYMTTPSAEPKTESTRRGGLPTALATATFAVTLMEDCPLFNSGHGAVFTRDGINELEASVMVSRGHAKRGVGVMGLRRVRNPVQLARRMLEAGDADLRPRASEARDASERPNVDAGAQGHTQLYGAAAEALAEQYGLALVEPSYFFTQTRWDEHVRALEREKQGSVGTWSASEYLPQGTCGAVALDAAGVVCCATSTGGLTNKVTGRVGDTPVVGAGSWAGTWAEEGDPTGDATGTAMTAMAAARRRPSLRAVELSGALYQLLADCLPVPRLYLPLPSAPPAPLTTTRSMAVSGTGNGDSFLRVAAAHTVAAMAQYRPMSSADALRAVAGPGGLLQTSAGDRWGRTGEGEGGFIGIECAELAGGAVRSSVIQDYNCGGMFRAWIDDDGQTQVRIFR